MSEGFPVTLPQEGLVGLELVAPGNPAATTAEVVRSDAELDPELVRRALAACYRDHEQLRVRLDTSGTPGQYVLDPGEVRLEVIDCDGPTAEREALRRVVEPALDVRSGEVVRAALLRCADGSRLVHVAHHLVLDGIGAGLLLRAFSRHHEALLATGDTAELPAGPTVRQITDDDAERRRAPEHLAAVESWRGYRAELPVVESAGIADRMAAAAAVPLRVGAAVPESIRAGVARLRRELGVGWQTLLVTALGGLAQTSPDAGGPDDPGCAVGVPVSGRMGAGRPIGAGAPGTYVTVLPVLVPGGPRTLAEACAEVAAWERRGSTAPGVTQEHLLSADRAEGVVRVPSVQINVMPFAEKITLHGRPAPVRNLRVGPVPRWTLTLRGGWEDPLGVRIEVDANPTLGEGVAERLLARALRRLEALAAAGPDTSLVELPRCGAPEEQVVTALWARDPHPVRARTLLQAFADGVAAHPGRPALAGDRQLTALQVWHGSAALAAALADRGVGPGDVVGVHLPRSVDQVLLAHALLHLGAVYLPLHVEVPAERRADMCRQAEAALVVDTARYAELAVRGRELHDPDSDELPPAPVAAPAGLDEPAYILFTSGSTGRPKGVVITHRAIDNRLEWMQHECRLTADQTVLYKTPCSFDVHVWELYWSLRVGALLRVAPEGAERDPEALAELLVEGRVDVVHFVPGMLRALLGVPSVVRRLAGARVRELVCSGEALGRSLAEAAHSALGVWPLNLYGPTEAAVDVTYFRTGPDQYGADVPIGRPVWNTSCLVLDGAGRPVPPGAPGELHLGGVQLSPGYLGRPDLTAAAFVDYPRFGRLYRTGDIASWDAEGNLVYHGRRDGQVKIRGQRVELGEIEAVLSEVPGVLDAVCLVDDGAITAHLLGDPGSALDADTAHRAVAGRLTSAMTPSGWVVHTAWPTTANGKVDRRALAAIRPEPATGAQHDAVAEPDRDDVLLAAICGAFGEVLGTRCGPDDGFFAAGGDSLGAVRLVGAVERAVGWAPTLEQVLSAPTPRALAAASGREETEGYVVLAEGEPGREPLVLLPPAGGLCWSYLPLVAHLAAGRRVVALQTPLLTEPDWPGTTLDELCAWQAEVIARACPDTAVHLAGWSVGGTCAQALAAGGGPRVLSVGLLDAYPCEQWRTRPEPGEAERLGALLRMGGVDESTVDRPVASREDVARVLAERGSPLAVLGEDVVTACLETVALTARMIRSHHTAAFAGPAVHVGAQASVDDGLDPGGWEPFVGSLRTVRLDGDHVQVVRPDNAAVVAAALEEAMAGVTAGAQ